MALVRFISTNNIIAESIYYQSQKVIIFIDQRWCYDVPNLQPAVANLAFHYLYCIICHFKIILGV